MTIATFETLPLGATTAAAAGFDFLAAPAGGGATVIDTNPYRGAQCLQLTTGTAGAICYAERSTTLGVASSGQLYGRARFRLPVLPSDATGMRLFVVADSAGAFLAELRMTNAGRIQLRSGAGTILATAAATVAAGQWCDLGLAVLAFSATIGQAQLVVFAGDGTIAETLTSTATLNTLGAAGTTKAWVGAIRSGLASFVVVVDDVDWTTTGWPTTPTAPTVQNGPWTGAVTPTGFTAAYRLSGATAARLVASTTAELTNPATSGWVSPDSDGIVKLPITGLTPDTAYHYALDADGVVLDAGRGEARTFPPAGLPASYSLWFGSCQWTVPTALTYAAILNRTGPTGRALLGIHMGDLHYRDWGATTTAADILTQYWTSFGSAAMAPALAAIPFNYAWDNHDWGGDTSDLTAPAGDLVAAGYRQVIPSYPLPSSDGRGCFHSWVIGRVRFIQLDVRSFRTPQAETDGPDKTMLGAEQVAWFKTQLSAPEPLKVVCGNYYWRQDNVSSGRWGSYGYEFEQLNAYIQEHDVRVYVLFGDRHALCADDGSAPGAYGVPQAGGAPIQQGSVAGGSGESWSAGYYHTAPDTLQAYGWLDIVDSGTAITLHYQGITSLDGVTRVEMTTSFEAANSLPAVWGIHL